MKPVASSEKRVAGSQGDGPDELARLVARRVEQQGQAHALVEHAVQTAAQVAAKVLPLGLAEALLVTVPGQVQAGPVAAVLVLSGPISAAVMLAVSGALERHKRELEAMGAPGQDVLNTPLPAGPVGGKAEGLNGQNGGGAH